jgi:hypothetical protein
VDLIAAGTGTLTVAFSLVQNAGTHVTIAPATNILGQDPLLGPLQNNGGTTATFLLAPGSPALGHGKNFAGSPLDQRGKPRSHNGIVNIGAVEIT